MEPTIFQMGYQDALSFMKLAQGTAIVPYSGATWLPPGSRPEKPWMFQGSEAAAHARRVGADKAPPGLLRKAWSKFRGLPGKTQIGIGLGAAGALGGLALMRSKTKGKPPSRFEEGAMRPELQAQAYRQPYQRPQAPQIPGDRQISPELKAYLQQRAMLA